VRIKAIEALGRMRARKLPSFFRKLPRTAKASPIRTCWPAAAAEDALALIENRPFVQASRSRF